MARPEKIRLGELLVHQKLISEAQLQIALDEQKKSGRKLGRFLVENSYVTEMQIAEAIAKQLQIPYIQLKNHVFNPDTTRLLPEMQARRFRALVLVNQADQLLIGMADPTDLQVYDELSRIVKKTFDLAVVNENELLQTIDRVYRKTEVISSLAQELQNDLGDGYVDFASMNILSGAGAEDAPVVKLLQSVFDDATQVRASDIHIEPQADSLQIRFRIDGVLNLQTRADIKIASALALRLKLMAGLDISEKRLPQDGRFAIKVKQLPIDVRFSTMPTQYGESVVMRLLNQSGNALNLDKIGMPTDMLARFRRILQRPNGLILVTGPTGSGKTTTLYGALSELNNIERKIITVEDPIEYRLPGINQVQVNEKIDLGFARVLRATLRQDPDVLLVGEMRDQETAQIGMRAAITGHMVLSTLHTNDAASTPIRLMDMGIPRYMVATSIQAVLAQRLIRVICADCSEAYTPNPNEQVWWETIMGEAPSLPRFQHGLGCTQCNHTGYRGRMGVYEMLEMTKAVAEAASHEDPAAFIQAAQTEMAGNTLGREAARLAAQGKTTLAEAMRISNQFEE